MYKVITDVNSYVEEGTQYQADKVILNLAEDTFTVTVYPCDEYGVAVVGAEPIVTAVLADLPSAIAYYQKMERQLSEGDRIRNI